MKTAIRTLKKIVVEVERSEMDTKGFDTVWDEIRGTYPESNYDLFVIENTSKDDAVFFELTHKG